MTYSTYGPNERGPGERWSFNLPLAIGVVFVFLVGVIAWVVASSGDETVSPASTTTSTMPPVVPSLAPPLTASPIPIPAITLVTAVPTTLAVTVPVTVPVAVPGPTAPAPPPAPATTLAADPAATTTAAPPTLAPVTATTAPGAAPDAVPGDLGIANYPMSKPPCDDKYITIIASAIGEQATAAGIEGLLDDNNGASYLRTDQTCPSLSQASDGKPIYVVYLGPFGSANAACEARSRGPQGSYARQLSNTVGPDHFVDCS